MGQADIFNAEDRVQIPFSELYALMETTAQAQVKEQLIENAIKCNLPHAHIRCMLTGENDELTAYRATGLTPEKIVEIDTRYSEKCEALDKMRDHLEAVKAENAELRRHLDMMQVQSTQAVGV